jgi:hypothetical protein
MKFNLKSLLVFTAVTSLTMHAHAQKSLSGNLVIKKTPIVNAMEFINSLQPVSFEYNRKMLASLPEGRQFNFFQEQSKILVPDLLVKKTYWYAPAKNQTSQITMESVDLQKLVPFLIKAFQEQQKEINDLKQQSAIYKTTIENLKLNAK